MTTLEEHLINHKKQALSAHHEAGHTVIGYRFGQIINSVSIKPDELGGGSCLFWATKDQEKIIAQEALICLAGDAAQKYFHPDDKTDPSITDISHALRIFKGGESYRSLFPKIKQLIAENEKQIHAVADALLECETIEGHFAMFIIDSVDNSIDWKQSTEWVVYKKFHKEASCQY